MDMAKLGLDFFFVKLCDTYTRVEIKVFGFPKLELFHVQVYWWRESFFYCYKKILI